MTDFVDEFIEKFDDFVYKTLSRMEVGDGKYDPAVRPVGYSSYDISNSIDERVRNKLGSSVMMGLTDLALNRLERAGSVTSRPSHGGNVWRTNFVLDAMAMLPKPHHADD